MNTVCPIISKEKENSFLQTKMLRSKKFKIKIVGWEMIFNLSKCYDTIYMFYLAP